MTPVKAGEQSIRRALQQVLDSAVFARHERLSRLLRFIVERHLAGRDDELKESVIGTELFRRKPDYNPKTDAIVRTEVRRLRALLNEYYLGEGKADPLLIELPKGAYVPAFRELGLPAPPARKRPTRLLAGVALLLLAAGSAGWWWTRQRLARPIAIAVLPLENLSRDPANEYFADGLTDELIRNLANIEGLTPRSRTSSFTFKGKPRKVREVGKQLDVDYVVEGSVLRAGGQLRVNAQLVRARDDLSLWSGKFNEPITDVLTIQEELSRNIVNALRLKLGRGRRRYETSAKAYDLYLRARATDVQIDFASLNRAANLYQQAIGEDPSFAPAYAGLAATYSHLSDADQPDEVERNVDFSKMRDTVEKALQLDPLLAEAHDAMGAIYAREGQWKESEKSFRRSLELDPSNSVTRRHFARFLLVPLGRIDEALAQVRMAEKADPLSPSTWFGLSYVLFSAGRIDEAAAYCPQPCTRALMLQGKAAEAIPILEALYLGHLSVSNSGELGYAYARAGRRAEAERVAASQWRPIEQAKIFAGLGDKDRTLAALSRAAPLGPLRIGRALTFPEFGLLRGDPRVKDLRRKVGLPE